MQLLQWVAGRATHASYECVLKGWLTVMWQED